MGSKQNELDRGKSVNQNTRIQSNRNYSIQIADGKVLKKNKKSIRNLWNNNKYSNICVIRVPEGEKKSVV